MPFPAVTHTSDMQAITAMQNKLSELGALNTGSLTPLGVIASFLANWLTHMEIPPSSGSTGPLLTGNTGRLDVMDQTGAVAANIRVNAVHDAAQNQVVSSRITGWTAASGTPTRATFATGSVTLPVLAEHVKALIDDLMTHGMIST